MAYVPFPPHLYPENFERRKRKATYSILNTAQDFENAQRRVQKNDLTTGEYILDFRPGTIVEILGTKSTGPR